ncbi:MAG: hypothetical protein FWB91_07950 [Defluviitaleaceae bacterium]|nr:hypothetical protein [Defluviitaleaceae bacterium]
MIELKCETCLILAEMLRQGTRTYFHAHPALVALWVVMVISIIGFIGWRVVSERNKKRGEGHD